MSTTKSMDEDSFRHLEKQYKLRVKTGCRTCRIRKIKCDETQPACLRCTKTGRTCDGYAHLVQAKKGNHAVAANYRNSSFLVVPKRSTQLGIYRSPKTALSEDPKERRSFEYFQSRALPMWTEFFESELDTWSRTVLQLSHNQPAIKHGLLALSIMHERYEGIAPLTSFTSQDFAFVQYMHAIKHSNQLLTAYQKGKVSLEIVLIACIIFTCYENLVGDYKAASMHLRNGLRILDESKHDQQSKNDLSRSPVAHSLYRFDFEAMTFSDNASRYDYELDLAPVCPRMRDIYTTNEHARDDLVGILRCMMWCSGVVDKDPTAAEHSEWLRVHKEMSLALRQWEATFESYQQKMLPQDQTDTKIYAGNTLLRMAAIMIRIIVGSGGGSGSEMAWDPFIDSFKTVIELAETIPILRPPQSTRTKGDNSSPSSSAPKIAVPRTIALNPASAKSNYTPTTATTIIFSARANAPLHPPSSASRVTNAPFLGQTPEKMPSYFSPSFELSPIVPLFITACRFRRREGVWDSLGAGMVAAQCLKKEENIDPHVPLGFDNVADFLARPPTVTDRSEVLENARVKDIYVEVKMVEGRVDLVYSMTSGAMDEGIQVLYESRGDGGLAAFPTQRHTGVQQLALNHFLSAGLGDT
ncbi:hypothetical protein DE146DRAFT_653543 [Phaeosphaeria sp. MPI-PUGE-AT-0046c]|nr:hypothetical protein DE146DRAFT_653543 [Phaeosphaeria sp. MPI-PUGE-AT-0046c]